MKELNTLDKVLITMGFLDFWFVVVMIVIFCIYRAVPDTLILAVFGATFGECGCCSYIWKTKKVREIENRDSSSCDNSLPDGAIHIGGEE